MRRTPSSRARPATPRAGLRASVVALLAASFWAAPGPAPEARAQMPGPETFAKPPQTPMELWEAVDYLVRTGQVRQAVPYLDRFMKSEPDDATLLRIRDRYGVGSILRLDDYPETRGRAATLGRMLAEASRRNATKAERIERFVATLTASPEEQTYAVERLREAGPYAVPFIIQALERPGLPDADRGLIVYNLGRLDRSAVPPLIAALDSSDARLVVDAAGALGAIGDPRAVPHLMYVAAPEGAAPARQMARLAIERLTGRSFESQPKSPVRLLVDEARKYHLHAVAFPGDSVVIWEWDPAQKAPVPRQVSRSEAEAFFGQRLAREALRLDPADVPAQVVLLGLALEKAVERAGPSAYLGGGDPTGAMAAALAAGPDVLGRVLRTAIADGKMDLAAAAATALGQVADREVLATDRRVHPLVEALTAPGRRVQFAAARALVLLAPRRPFAGSSQVVPTLARFVSNQSAPRAVVIDGNVIRGGQLAGSLHELGYDATLAQTGADGFRFAAETADVELILIDAHMIEGSWRLVDTLANLRADARTAGVPVYIVGPLAHRTLLDATLANYPGVKFLVTPNGPELLERQLGGRPSGLSDDERAGYAREAAALLATLAAQPGGPFEPDLRRVEPALAVALNSPTTSQAASTVLGDVPDQDAQRGLADVLLDPSKPAPLRLSVAGQLARSIQRFGPLVTADQEAKLLQELDEEADPALRAALATVVGALRPRPAQTGQRLQQSQPLPAAAPAAPANPTPIPAPEPGPSPPAPEATPAEAAPAPLQEPAQADAGV